MNKRITQWTKEASKLLLNKTIVDVRYMTDEEQSMMHWDFKPVVLILDDGTAIYPSSDDEGNYAGALFTNNENLPVVPVIY
jgi:hypothetical protein